MLVLFFLNNVTGFTLDIMDSYTLYMKIKGRQSDRPILFSAKIDPIDFSPVK